MGRLLDDFVKKHNLPDTTALALLGIGCVSIMTKDSVPVSIKARVEELEQDAHRILDNAASIMFSMRGGFTLDPTFKDGQ